VGNITGRVHDEAPESTIVCMVGPKSHLAVPCGHQLACERCTANMTLGLHTRHILKMPAATTLLPGSRASALVKAAHAPAGSSSAWSAIASWKCPSANLGSSLMHSSASSRAWAYLMREAISGAISGALSDALERVLVGSGGPSKPEKALGAIRVEHGSLAPIEGKGLGVEDGSLLVLIRL